MVSAEERTTLERVIDEWARHWSSHDLDSLLSLFTDDVVFEDVAQGAVHRGKDGLRAFAERVFAEFSDVTLELTSSVAAENRGGGEWVMRAPTGAKFLACRLPVGKWTCAEHPFSSLLTGRFDAMPTAGIWRRSSSSSG